MKKQRFTNGNKKVLKRQYIKPEEVDIVVENSTLWERGTGINSLIPKNRSCTASGKNSLAKGYKAYCTQNYAEAFASGSRLPNIFKAQKNQIVLTGSGDEGSNFFVLDEDGRGISVSGKTYITGRAIVQVAAPSTKNMISIFIDFSISCAGGITINHYTRTTEYDGFAGHVTASIEKPSTDTFSVRIETGEKILFNAMAFVEWIEMRES